VFKENPKAYARERDAFVDALRPCNAAAEVVAERMFKEYQRLDRMDLFESKALAAAGAPPQPSPALERERDAALGEVEDCDLRLAAHDDARERYLEGAMRPQDYDFLLAISGGSEAMRLSTTLEGLVPGDEGYADVTAGIEQWIAHRHGSIDALLDWYGNAAEQCWRIAMVRLDAFRPPTPESPEARAASAARELIDTGFFERLGRPRAAAARTLRELREQYKEYQALGPGDEPA
jgi:hypothetical protein